jgi:pectinesterase
MKYYIQTILFLTILLFNVIYIHSQSKTFDKIIAPDGTGDYVSVKTAISQYGASRKVFFIKNGTYTEKILIDAAKINVRLIGESRDGVIITYSDYSGKAGVASTADSYTVRVDAPGFYAENITFQNTATAAQAVAIYTKADTITFKNCRFLGYQDTHYADGGRQYFQKCEIRGDVDFVFGNAAAMLDSCSIICRNRKAGYVTAPSASVITSSKPGGGNYLHGLLFKNCSVDAEAGLADNSCYLGRPWGPTSASVFYRCKIGTHIKQEGWSDWGNDNHLTSFFAEYHSQNLTGAILDTSLRASWSYQVKDADTVPYSIANYFLGWDPLLKTAALLPPSNVIIKNDSVKWDAVLNARGYILLRNDSAISFPNTTGISIASKLSEIYRVKTVNKFGGLSLPSEIAKLSIPDKITNPIFSDKNIYISNNILKLPSNIKTEVFDITGKKQLFTKNRNNLSLETLPAGIYIIKVMINNKEILVKKIYKN